MIKLQSITRTVTQLPEFNVGMFALLLNFPWEILQGPLFNGMATAPHWDIVKGCTWATFGDAFIMLVAYWSVAARAGSRRWILSPTSSQLLLFVAVGAMITVVIESLAIRGLWLGSWDYSPLMPVIPGIGVGLSPLLQWLLLPPLAAWFVRRQVRSHHI